MTPDVLFLIEKLAATHSLTLPEYETLLVRRDREAAELLQKKADSARRAVYQNRVFIRGLIEISNVCKNDCFYCGVRASNQKLCRYRLTPEEILEAALHGYEIGFRTFVLQGGENDYYTDELLALLIGKIKRACPGSAVTLSLGERGEESFRALREAGADRYLLRHETANARHYARLHPEKMLLSSRMHALYTLKELGFQVGCGFMVGSPYQSLSHLAEDLKFVEEFRPAMCGIGPFLPHSDTPFGTFPPGDTELCLYLISILRLIDPALLLPATTALSTIAEDGRERGIQAGANVIMPNLSPDRAKENYTLYNNKKITGAENAEKIALLESSLRKIGFSIDTSRGDYAAEPERTHHGTL